MQGQAKFIEAVVAYYLLLGNTYIEAVKGFENQPRQSYGLSVPIVWKLFRALTAIRLFRVHS